MQSNPGPPTIGGIACGDIRERGGGPDFDLFSLVLDYIELVPERLHLQKEDGWAAWAIVSTGRPFSGGDGGPRSRPVALLPARCPVQWV